jgi:hypothetical protein
MGRYLVSMVYFERGKGAKGFILIFVYLLKRVGGGGGGRFIYLLFIYGSF